MVIRPYLVAGCLVLPLLAPEVWSGFRVGLSDPVLGFVSTAEQPLSVRHPGALWAVALVLAWFALAYWQRRFVWWEAALVVAGGAAALLRAGNLWVLALTLLVPLAHRIAEVPQTLTVTTSTLAATGVIAALATALVARPAGIPPRAVAAVAASPSDAAIIADARWATDLQERLGNGRRVLDAGPLQSQTSDFWIDYLRVERGHERWDGILRDHGAGVLVLDAAGDAEAAADLLRRAPDWRVTFDEDGALVAERVAP